MNGAEGAARRWQRGKAQLSERPRLKYGSGPRLKYGGLDTGRVSKQLRPAFQLYQLFYNYFITRLDLQPFILKQKKNHVTLRREKMEGTPLIPPGGNGSRRLWRRKLPLIITCYSLVIAAICFLVFKSQRAPRNRDSLLSVPSQSEEVNIDAEPKVSLGKY